MRWSHDREVAAIERRHLGEVETFRCGDDGRVDGSERQISVVGDELGNSQPIASGDRLGEEAPRSEVTEEADLGIRPESGLDEARHLGDDENGNEERPGMLLEKLKALGMVAVVCVDVGVQGPGVDQQRYGRTSARRISSIRSDTSERPLAPAPAAISLRRPLWEPRYSSMASLVTSEMVVARRSASWRRRASNSSGSFTVVLFMVCQHTLHEVEVLAAASRAAPVGVRGDQLRSEPLDAQLRLDRPPDQHTKAGPSSVRHVLGDPRRSSLDERPHRYSTDEASRPVHRVEGGSPARRASALRVSEGGPT